MCDIKTRLRLIQEGYIQETSKSSNNVADDSKILKILNAIEIPDNPKIKYAHFELFDDFNITLFFMDNKNNEVSKSHQLSFYKDGMELNGKVIEDASRDFDIIFKHFRSIIKKSKFHQHPKVSSTMNYHDTYPVQVLDR